MEEAEAEDVGKPTEDVAEEMRDDEEPTNGLLERLLLANGSEHRAQSWGTVGSGVHLLYPFTRQYSAAPKIQASGSHPLLTEDDDDAADTLDPALDAPDEADELDLQALGSSRQELLVGSQIH